MIDKGQFGPTQRGSNKIYTGSTNRSRDTAKQQMQDTVTRAEHNINLLLCRLCAPGMVTGILSLVIYTGVHNPNAAFPVFATASQNIRGQTAKRGDGTWPSTPDGQLLGSIWSKLRCLLSEEVEAIS